MEDCSKVPTVSVIIPMYNAGQFVGSMIESVIQQTFKDWELLIVDDGSTDNSVEVVEAYCKKDARIRLIIRPESRIKGACTCRNIGFEQARGQYVIWLDADDLIAPYCLEQRVKFMDENSDVDFAVFPALPFKKVPLDTVEYYHGYIANTNCLKFLINRKLPFVVVTNIYRRLSLKEKSISWDEHLKSLQDSDFNISSLLSGLKVRDSLCPPDYFVRFVPNSISQRIRTRSHFESHIYYFSKITGYFDGKKEYADDINLMLYWATKIIGSDVELYNDFLNLPYFRKNRILKFKFKLFFICNSKVRFHKLQELCSLFLMPKIYIHFRMLNELFPFNYGTQEEIKYELTNRIKSVYPSYYENLVATINCDK